MKAAIFLPIAYVSHLAEEWFGGLSDWTFVTLGFEITVERFLLINGIALPLFVIGTWAALHKPGAAWIAVTLAALLGFNGILHSLGSVAFASYMPGTVTGLLLYIPLSIIVLRSASTQLAAVVFRRSIAFGVLLHALITILAFL